MKKFYHPLSLLFILGLFVACSELEGEEQPANDKYGLYVTGIKESVTYQFDQGRVENAPDEVKQLTVLILNDEGQVVYDHRYYDDYGYYYYRLDDAYGPEGNVLPDSGEYESSIPDTVFIPELAEGHYTLVAITADFWYDPYYSDNTGFIEPYLYSNGAVYAGRTEFELNEEGLEVPVEMNNISAKVRVKLKDGQDIGRGYLNVSVETVHREFYNIFTGEFGEWPEWGDEYHNYLWTYLGETWIWNGYEDYYTSINENNMYMLPGSLLHLTLDYWDEQGFSINQTIVLDPEVELGVGDAITFTIDLDALLEGAGSGIFDWGDVEWNELEEINVP